MCSVTRPRGCVCLLLCGLKRYVFGWQLFFLAINPDHFPIESYDAFGEDYYDTGNDGYWGGEGHHAIKVNDP
jgi:hypothetical protein